MPSGELREASLAGPPSPCEPPPATNPRVPSGLILRTLLQIRSEKHTVPLGSIATDEGAASAARMAATSSDNAPAGRPLAAKVDIFPLGCTLRIRQLPESET